MQLERRPHQNFKGTLNHLSQLERNPESPTTSREEPYAITRKDHPVTKLEAPAPKTGENSPAKIR